MNNPITPSNYEYNCELVELHKEKEKIDLINFKSFGLPFEKVYQIKKNDSNFENTIILPDLNCYVVYTELLSGEKKLIFVGPRSKSIEIRRSTRLATTIAQLPPSGISFKKTPAHHELINTTTSIRNLFGDIVEEQLINIFTACSPQTSEVFNDDSLSFNRGNRNRKLDEQVNTFLEKTQFPTVSELAKNLGLSERHMRNLYYKQYGMPPKTVLKIKRLHRSLLTSAKEHRYSQIALKSGYFDQSHMIAEYQLLIGKTPKQLFG